MTTASARNAGLRRLSVLTRWVAASAVGVTAIFSVMAARATAGKAVAPTATSNPSTSDKLQTPADSASTATAPTPSGGLSQDLGQSNAQPATLAPPVQAPVPSYQAPVVVSGSS